MINKIRKKKKNRMIMLKIKMAMNRWKKMLKRNFKIKEKIKVNLKTLKMSAKMKN